MNKESAYKFFDIAANLTDETFYGKYYGKQHHDQDLDAVIQRALDIGCDRLLIASGYLDDAPKSFEIAQKSDNFYCTVGVHPCRADDVNKKSSQEDYFAQLDDCISKFGKKCVAIGECGLDYDRLEYSSKEQQLKVFPFHFDLAQKYNLPMYLHSRNTSGDFIRIVKENRHKFSTGVVHSFTGDLEELKQCLDLGLFIGINGCSLKTEENLEVVKQIPIDRIMLETDCPYCDIKNSHASKKYVKTQINGDKKKEKFEMGLKVKGRNEPANIIQVLEVVAALLQKSEKEISDQAYQNTLNMFQLK